MRVPNIPRRHYYLFNRVSVSNDDGNDNNNDDDDDDDDNDSTNKGNSSRDGN